MLSNNSNSFWELWDMNWSEDISTHALTPLCQAFHWYLTNIRQTAYQALETSKSNTEACYNLSSTSLTEVILFNGRHGAVSEIKLLDFEDKHTVSGTGVLHTQNWSILKGYRTLGQFFNMPFSIWFFNSVSLVAGGSLYMVKIIPHIPLFRRIIMSCRYYAAYMCYQLR